MSDDAHARRIAAMVRDGKRALERMEGEEDALDDLPESDMNNSGKLEAVGDGKLAAKFGDTYVTFEWASVCCTDVREVDDL